MVHFHVKYSGGVEACVAIAAVAVVSTKNVRVFVWSRFLWKRKDVIDLRLTLISK